MADSKITALTSISTSTDPANDPLVIVDVSDTSMAATGTTKKVTLNQLLGASGTATLASATITGDLTVRTTRLTTTTTGVGIGTATPILPLDVRGTAGAGALFLRTTDPTAPVASAYIQTPVSTGFSSTVPMYGFWYQNCGMGNPAAENLSWIINSSEAMRLNSTGLGVGTSPAANSSLTVYRANSNSALRVTNGPSANNVGITLESLGGNVVLNNGNGPLEVSVGGSLRATIDTSGNVGIGVTPSASDGTLRTLNVGYTGVMYGFVGTSEAAGFGSNYYYNAGWKYRQNGTATNFATSSGKFVFSTSASGTAGNAITWTDAMTLDASGNLLVGVTTTGNRLDVQKSTDCTVLVKSTGANANVALDYVSTYGNHTIRKSGTAVWDFGVINDASATPAFKVSNASSVGVQLVSGATSWTTLSDETVKDIIEPISNAVAKVGSIRSVIGKFKTDDSGKRRSFLIAQDVQSVLPEAVDVIGENNELGLRYTEVIPLLVAAIKELTARVQTLETR